MATYLVTGIAGGLSHAVARRLVGRGDHVVGVDYRPHAPLEGELAVVKTYQANYNKTNIEDVFRREPIDYVLHLGRVGNLKESIGKRFDLNVVGSQKIMNLCVQHKVKGLVVLSTFHIYGAHHANHIPIAEGEPLRAGTDFPQLADAIQLDNMATTWVYQHRNVHLVVLRPTNVIGPEIHNAMSSFLRQKTVPHLAGFNPMTQFVHQDDLADAILLAARPDEKSRGIYNLAGKDAVPWRTALALAHARTFPMPSSLVSMYVKTFTRFPGYLINFFKYPCVISDEAFRTTFDWAPKIGLADALWSTVKDARARQAAAG